MNIYQINQKEFKATIKETCPIKKLVHDIRSPLQTLGIIAAGHFDEDINKDQIINQCILRIQSLTDRSLAKSDEINLPNMIKLLCDQKKVELGIRIRTQIQLNDQVLPLSIAQGLLIEALSNLINNSYDSKNCSLIKLKISQTAHEVVISVIDNGSGIKQEHLSRIGSFGQTFKEKGSGIGVASCISIISKAGGKVSCQTILNHGTKMTLRLPIKKT